MTTRRWGWALGLWALFMLAGCIKVDQTLTLEADGSGTLAMRYGMAEETLAQLRAMEQMSAQAGDGLSMEQEMPFDFDPEELRAEFEADKPVGVELVSLSSEVVNGWKFIDLELAFDDVRALKRTDLFKDSRLAITPARGGNFRISQRGGGTDLSGDAAGRQLMPQMTAMLAGFRIAQTIVVPGEIIETNATRVDGRRASWVFDILQDPNVMQTLADTDLELLFTGDGVKLPLVSP
jgi:hypothetical protein